MFSLKRREVAAPVPPMAPAVPPAPRRAWWAGFGLRGWAKTPRNSDPVSRDAAFKVYEPAPGVLPQGSPTARQMAMDGGLESVYDFSAEFGYYARARFLGYPYLAQLAQETEYRRPAEIIADHMTRKWITLTSASKKNNTEKLKAIDARMKALGVQDAFRQVALQGEFFGRSQIYIDTGYNDEPTELRLPLFLDPRKVKKGGKKGSLRAIRVVEPYWSYPNQYNSTQPLRGDFYKPATWFVMSQEVHHTRLLTFVPHEVPDILKPMYAFGGLSLTQMLMVDVQNWDRTRKSVSDITHNYAVRGIKTDLGALLQGEGVEGLQGRAEFISDTADNQGILLLDDQEDFFTSTVPLSSLDLLQAQAQEHMAAPAGIPLIIRFGITPSGLNATSDGELQVWADRIHAQQEHVFTPHLSTIIKLIQLSEFGEIDPDIGFKYESLQRADMLELANVQKVHADTDAVNIGSGVISPEEARQTLAADEDGRYAAIDLEGPAPEPPTDPAGDPPSDHDDSEAVAEEAGALDSLAAFDAEFSESDHPRAENGEFGSGGSKRLDHGELNVPGRLNNLNAELDRYKKNQAAEMKSRAKTAAAQNREEKALAKGLFAEHGEAMIQRHGEKFGHKELRAHLDSMVKWEPAKFIKFADKFLGEQGAK